MELDPRDAQWWMDDAFARMAEAARTLGDHRVNRRPDLDGANSVFAIITHCLAMSSFWIDHVVLGTASDRARDAEFEAEGTVPEAEAAVAAFRARLPGLLENVAASPEPAHGLSELVDWSFSTTGVVLHVIEELYQHLGHIDLTVDLLVSAASSAEGA